MTRRHGAGEGEQWGGCIGDSTITGALELDGAFQIDGSAQVNGLVSFGANNVYDSTWFDCSVKGTYLKTHDQSSTCLLAQLWFKDTGNQLGEGADRIYQVPHFEIDYPLSVGASLNNLTATQVTVQAAEQGVVACLSESGGQALCTTGQYRLLLMRLV